MKVLFVLLVGFPWVTAQYQVCPYVDPSSSQIAVISDRFHLILYLHELKPLDNLVNNLKTLSNDIRVFITIYLESELKNKRDQFNVNYTLIKKFVPEAARTDLWNFFHKSQNNDKKTSKILIVMSELYFTHSMEESLEQLKKAGVEIFILHYGKVNYDLHPIASSPKEQHIYRSLKFEELDTIQAELAQSVCVSIQNHDLIAKRELFSQFRLVNGGGTCKGRIEVFYKDTWGWLSDELWDRTSASVLCRQLNCGPVLEILKGDPFGPGSGPFLQKAVCTGTEDDLAQCLLGMWTEEDSKSNHQSAGVSCLTAGIENVRLVDGSGQCDGIVEFSVTNQPGRLCAWDFDVAEASVICRQLGCGPLKQAQHTQEEVDSSVRMVERMMCSGVESKVSECNVRMRRPETCYLNVHAGVVCSTKGLSKVTLVGGHSTCSGKVMVQHNGTSSAVCADDWSMPNDVVVCRDVGCGPAIESIEHRKVIKQPKVNIQRLYCSGNEQNLSQCAAVLSNDYKCDTDAANVLCSQSVISNVRLVNGSSSCSGRVEVYFKEMWGTVCDQHWDLHDASVVCKQVGCGTVLEAPGGAYFGAGSGPVWLDKVFCNGSESVLAQCGLLTTRRTQCAHTRDAGVVCTGKKELQP